jgi:hypothetical protein
MASGIAQSSSLLICESGWVDRVTQSRLYARNKADVQSAPLAAQEMD